MFHSLSHDFSFCAFTSNLTPPPYPPPNLFYIFLSTHRAFTLFTSRLFPLHTGRQVWELGGQPAGGVGITATCERQVFYKMECHMYLVGVCLLT